MTEHKAYRASAVSSAQNNTATMSDYFTSYMQMNPGIGYLTFEVFNNSPLTGRVPVPNAKITVSKLLGDDYYISKILNTDVNGETEPLPLPTVSRSVSLKPGEGRAYATYHASVEAPGFQKQDIYDIQVFEGVTSVQRVPLQRSVKGGAGASRLSVR